VTPSQRSLTGTVSVENRSRSLNTAEAPPQAGSPRIPYTTRRSTIDTMVY
jgi:hypothetical protein